jgi:hypothetical protein
MLLILRHAAPATALMLTLAACASTGPGGVDTNPYEITRAEIQEVDAVTALEVVERLRPRWLRAPLERSHTRTTEVVVYLNGALFGDVGILQEIGAATIQRLRWLDSAQAGRLPGLGSRHVAGAIVVETL